MPEPKQPLGCSELTITQIRRRIAASETELAWLRSELSAKVWISCDADRRGFLPPWLRRRHQTGFRFTLPTPAELD